MDVKIKNHLIDILTNQVEAKVQAAQPKEGSQTEGKPPKADAVKQGLPFSPSLGKSPSANCNLVNR